MFGYDKVISDFGLDSQTSKEMLDAINLWTDIFNGNPPWKNEEVRTLNVAKTICEKVSKAATIELKTSCDDEYINKIYQKFIKNIRKNTEYGIGKGSMYFKPTYENGKIKISVIQGDKIRPFKFDDTGELLGIVIIDQITRGNDVYTRFEYNELIGTSIKIKNIAYKGEVRGVVLSKKINLTDVDKWKDLQSEMQIDNVDRLLGGFFTMKNANTVDNNSPMGVSIFHNALSTLEEIDKQFSRTLWEYEGSELAIEADSTLFQKKPGGAFILPKGKKRLYRILNQLEDGKKWNVFSPEIRDNSLFNGLNELLRQVESECGLSFGILSKLDKVALTATEIKSSKQDYYVTVSDIQASLQDAIEDMIYGIYVLCRLYKLPVGLNYKMTFDWDDSILVDKESLQRQSLIEKNADIIDDIQYIMDTRNYTEEEAINFCKKIQNRKLSKVDEEPPKEE